MLALSRRSPARRLLVAALAASALAFPALAAEKLVEIGKVFPYLDTYLKIPAAERNRFVLAYRLSQGGKPVAGVKAWIVDHGARTPLTIGADGRVEHLPTLGQIQGGAKLALDAPSNTKFGISMDIEPLMRPAAELDAPSLMAAVDQAAVSSKKAAGMMGFAVPKFERVYFKGASGGEIVWADGKRSTMGMAKGVPIFDVASGRRAKTLRFAKPPTQMSIGPAK